MKRFAVSVRNGFFITGDGDLIWQYEHKYFDTCSEARRFVKSFPHPELLTGIMDLERLPF